MSHCTKGSVDKIVKDDDGRTWVLRRCVYCGRWLNFEERHNGRCVKVPKEAPK